MANGISNVGAIIADKQASKQASNTSLQDESQQCLSANRQPFATPDECLLCAGLRRAARVDFTCTCLVS